MFFKTLLREIKELVYSIAKHIIHIIAYNIKAYNIQEFLKFYTKDFNK